MANVTTEHEEVWNRWLESANQAAEKGLGRVESKAEKPKKWDAHLRWLLQQRNESRRIRHRTVGMERQQANEMFGKYRKLVKRWLRSKRELQVNRVNSELKGLHPFKGYWEKLKRFVGISKPRKSIPMMEAHVDG